MPVGQRDRRHPGPNYPGSRLFKLAIEVDCNLAWCPVSYPIISFPDSTMYFAVSFHFQSVVYITILLAAISHALPLETRAPGPTRARLQGLGCSDKGRGPCICGGELRLVPPRDPLTQCGENALTFLQGEVPFGLVSSSYSKEIMSPNPHDLDSNRQIAHPQSSGVGVWCVLVYQHSSDLTHELVIWVTD